MKGIINTLQVIVCIFLFLLGISFCAVFLVTATTILGKISDSFLLAMGVIR